MPELPEVETIRQRLRTGADGCPSIIGMEISGAAVLWERSLATPGVVDFLARVQGQTVEEVGRRGKYFVFALSSDYLLVHLRMSGDLTLEKQSEEINPYCRIFVPPIIEKKFPY